MVNAFRSIDAFQEIPVSYTFSPAVPFVRNLDYQSLLNKIDTLKYQLLIVLWPFQCRYEFPMIFGKRNCSMQNYLLLQQPILARFFNPVITNVSW